jgi:quinoprotein relay system zinc metallohydrolase 2
MPSTSISRHEFLLGGITAGITLSTWRSVARASPAFDITEVAPGVFVHQGQHALVAPANAGDISNCGFIVGRDAVAVIDAGGSASIGARLRDAIKATTDRPIRYVVLTHMHPDHVLGAAAFKADGAIVVAHAKMARGLAARADRYLSANRELMGEAAFAGTEIVLPTQGIDTRTTLDLGDRELHLEAHPTAHTDNDLTVLDVKSGTWFLGDLLFDGHIPTLDGSLRGWLSLLDQLTAQPVSRVVPGHGPPAMAWPDAAKKERDYLAGLADAIRTDIKAGRTMADAMARAGSADPSAWLLFEAYHARNVAAAYAELEWE